MRRPTAAARVLAIALGVGLAGELLLDGHAPGINVLLATIALLAAMVVVAGGVRRTDPLDAWIPLTALTLAAFVALRDDGPLVLLDLAGALGLVGASAAAFAGESVTRRTTLGIVGLGTRVAASAGFGAMPLLGRARGESLPSGRVAPQGTRLAPVARGLVLVVPLLVVFAALFASADPIFGRWVDAVLTLDIPLGEMPARLGFTALATWLAAGLLWFTWTAAPPVEPRSLGAAASSTGATAWFRIGAVEAVTALVALDLLFGAFVVLQLAYLFGGSDTLGAIGMTYSDYARRGFFELVAAVVIVGGLLLGLEAVVAQRTRAYVAAALGLVALTGVVLASSFVRLKLYQDAYGWTELRFYVLAAIAFLALCLVAAGVLIFRGRAEWLPHAVAVSALVVLVAVNVAGPQATVTERNLERVLVPSVVPEYGETTLDAAYLGKLDADAVPALVAALPGLPDAQRAELLPALERAWRRYVVERDASWQATNLARERARRPLEGLFAP